MNTYLVRFADGTEVETDARDAEDAQEFAIESLESFGMVVYEITSIKRCAATPL